MVHRSARRFFLVAVVSVGASFVPTTVNAQPTEKVTKKQCIAAYKEAQPLRREAKLIEAREQLIVCAQESCPKALRSDCVPWLAEVVQNTPTVVIDARDTKGKETTAVRVLIDGEERASQLDGTAMPVNPGERVFLFELGGEQTIEQRVLIKQGEKNRPIHADFSPEEPPEPPPDPITSQPPADQDVDAAKSLEIPLEAYVLGGVSLLALGSFTYFGLDGNKKERHLKDTCAPRCDQADVDVMKRQHLIADISLGIAAASLGVATWLVFSGKDSEPMESPVSIGLGAGPSGGRLEMRGQF